MRPNAAEAGLRHVPREQVGRARARTKSRGMVEGFDSQVVSTERHGQRPGRFNARTVIRKGGGVAFAKDGDTEQIPTSECLARPCVDSRTATRLLAKLVDGEVKCIDSLDFDAPRTSNMKARACVSAASIEPVLWHCRLTSVTQHCRYETSTMFEQSASIS